MGWTLVTGGAKGIGAAICRTMATEGHPIVVHYNTSQKEALEVAEDCRSLGVRAEIMQGNFSTQEQVAEFLQNYLQAFSLTDCLVNNVGNYLVKSVQETSPEELSLLYQTNVFAPIMIAKALSVKESIVNLGVAGLNAERADTYSSAYSMTKSSMLQWTRSLAKELASASISVNMVSPGYVEGSVDLPELSKLPMKRAVTKDEVARLVAFLLNKNNRAITGQNIEIAGGIRL